MKTNNVKHPSQWVYGWGLRIMKYDHAIQWFRNQSLAGDVCNVIQNIRLRLIGQ